jgi:hypothetical protein
VLIEPNSPSEGVRVAFIVHNGAPIEFIEIKIYVNQKNMHKPGVMLNLKKKR